jgi:steroid delta-isomerase-like uncharacterized protein
MLQDDNKALVRHRFEEFDKGNLGVFDDLFASTYVFHATGTENPLTRDEMREYYRALYSAIPDLRHTLDEQIAEGDKVMTRWTARGTHSGNRLFGVQKSGKTMTLRGINVYRIEGGKLAESHVSWDMLGLLQQLGIVPADLRTSLRAIGTWPTPERQAKGRAAAAEKAAKTRKRRSAGKKAARTRKRKAAARKAASTRKRRGTS